MDLIEDIGDYSHLFKPLKCGCNGEGKFVKLYNEDMYKCLDYGHNLSGEEFNKKFSKDTIEKITSECNHKDNRYLERLDEDFLICRVCFEKIEAKRDCRCYFDPSIVKLSEWQCMNNTKTFDCSVCNRHFEKCMIWDDKYIDKFNKLI